MSSYQKGIEEDATREQIIAHYIDEHELLRTDSDDAFQSSFDNNQDALREIWRIVQTRHATESDIAIADIRSELLKVIRSAAERYADMVILHRSFTAEVM